MKLKRREMLEHVLNPSKKVDDKFASYMVVTKSGRLLTGLLLKQTKEQVVIKDLQHKTITLSSDDVEQMARQSTSLMPDALLKDLTGQEAADLIAFLCSLQ